MGTSADRTAGSGGAWTPLKFATSSYLRNLSSPAGPRVERARRVLARHVPLLGGAGAAAASARTGRSGLQRLGVLLSGIGESGLAATLEAAGLGALVGRDRFDVLDSLVTLIAGDGDDLDSQAGRDAACEILDELFAEADSWDELDQTTVTREELAELMKSFLAQYVYNRVPVIAERLARITDPVAARRADEEMRQIVATLVELRLPEDPFLVDWSGPQGNRIADDAVRAVYETLEALDGSGE